MSDSRLRKAIIRLAHKKPELRPHLVPILRGSSRRNRLKKVGASRQGGLPKRFLNEMLSGAHNIIVTNATDSKVTNQVIKMVVRFARNLERRGIHIRDPKALAEDLLYMATVSVTWEDLNDVQEVLSRYVSGADMSDIAR